MFIGNGFPEIAWPAIPSTQAARILAMLFELEHTQWYSSDVIAAHQLDQIRRVVDFASKTVPFYRDLYGNGKLSLTDWSKFEILPVVRRREVQAADASIHSTAPPKHHGRIGQSLSSGSTGQPIRTLGTEVTRSFWRVFTLRDHFWHRRDLSGKLAAIRDTDSADVQPPLGKMVDNWGGATRGILTTGSAALLTIQSTIDEQVDWLDRIEPNYLMIYPSTGLALAKRFLESGRRLKQLREVRTFGEVLEPKTRQAIREAFDVGVVDTYSSQEVGYIALQCPQSANYHVQSENLLVEILDNAGRPCMPGQVGRVVLTTLHNFAMPLIRYELGDYAEVGPPCPCGRGLPVLTRILGRQRNILTMPDGSQQWPTLSRGGQPNSLPPIQQFQLIQRTISQLEAQVVTPAPLSDDDELTLIRYLQQTLGYPFDIAISRVPGIPRSPSGKYEDFKSDLITG